MPVAVSYPGVYIQEVPSGSRAIAGVPTSVAAFVGFTGRGVLDRPIQCFSFGDYERNFGGLRADSAVSYAAQQFFLNGGATCWVVPTGTGGTASTETFDTSGAPTIGIDASSPGEWGDALRITIDHDSIDSATQFNLTVDELGERNGVEVAIRTEVHRNLSLVADHPRFIVDVVNDASVLIEVAYPGDPDPAVPDMPNVVEDIALAGGVEATAITLNSTASLGDQDLKTGLYALEDVSLFNILNLPGMQPGAYDAAIAYAEERRSMILIDLPDDVDTFGEARTWITNSAPRHRNAVSYFPRILAPDSERDNRLTAYSPSATMAGLWGRTDASRGVWKAPAGIEARLRGVAELEYDLTDPENGVLNPLALNALRTFPVFGSVSWGARTLVGADSQANEWKYVPVRRIALFIEESLYRGTQFVVFEPNDEPLWAQIRLAVGSFMNNLFRQGAFQGATPDDAYFVRCDASTTTQADIDLGIVNIAVGFAPLKPAEFVVIQIQQMAGQSQA